MVVAYGLVYLILPIVLSQATIASYKMVAVIRQALTEAVYRKAVSIPAPVEYTSTNVL